MQIDITVHIDDGELKGLLKSLLNAQVAPQTRETEKPEQVQARTLIPAKEAKDTLRRTALKLTGGGGGDAETMKARLTVIAQKYGYPRMSELITKADEAVLNKVLADMEALR